LAGERLAVLAVGLAVRWGERVSEGWGSSTEMLVLREGGSEPCDGVKIIGFPLQTGLQQSRVFEVIYFKAE